MAAHEQRLNGLPLGGGGGQVALCRVAISSEFSAQALQTGLAIAQDADEVGVLAPDTVQHVDLVYGCCDAAAGNQYVDQARGRRRIKDAKPLCELLSRTAEIAFGSRKRRAVLGDACSNQREGVSRAVVSLGGIFDLVVDFLQLGLDRLDLRALGLDGSRFAARGGRTDGEKSGADRAR